MKENFLSDKPVSEEKEDKFQRYTFSKRIAQAIINRTNTESIVVGLYGAWGEGKTSVLNFIKQELKPSESNVIHFTFNPWRFTDESTLLTSFFNTLASELEKKIGSNTSSNEATSNERQYCWSKTIEFLETCFLRLRYRVMSWWKEKKGSLKTNKETIGKMMEKYGDIVSKSGVSGVSEVGGAAKAIGTGMSTVSIDELKERIELRLKKEKKRVVIFIDDIDRLEKNEIQAIFRLVKLTGNFAYITYLLSFDENIVSSAIGERFGAGDQKAGFHFLEKIIQIPIKLPLAQKAALENYCFNLVQQSLNASQIDLTEHEFQEFALEFRLGFLIRLTTPRLAVKYGNALLFSLPLLKGEVNYVDLLLIEAVRVFYPELYEFIRAQPDYFIGAYSKIVERCKSGAYGVSGISSKEENDKEKINKFNELFDGKTASYSPDEIECAKSVLKSLFPNLRKVWGSGEHSRADISEASRYNQQRISTTQYFNRYFSYTVIDGDISDVAFTSLLERLAEGDYEEQIEPTKRLIQSTTPQNFITKIRFKGQLFDSETSIALVKVLSQLGNCFPSEVASLYSLPVQVAMFLALLIRNQIAEKEQFKLLEWVIENTIPFKLADLIFYYYRDGKDEPKELFTDEQYKTLVGKLIERAKESANGKAIWEEFTVQSQYMLKAWVIAFDKQNLAEYVKQHLDKNPASVIPLLKVFIGKLFIHSISQTSYYDDFKEESYDWLRQILDANVIYEKVGQVLRVDLSSIDKYDHLEEAQTDENIMKQFAYWHNKNTNNTIQIAES